jgi:DNA-binding winged helix-turn-helix (wHTH) protein
VASGRYRFDRFTLDTGDRRLDRDGAPVEINSRYLDALALLVSEQGSLVAKERFLAEVWRGVPVTDEALTQCIKTLRRQLGDDASCPRFIETVPKHGYRFIADVEALGGARVERRKPELLSQEAILLWLAGIVGGAIAGVTGGLFYGFAAAADPLAPGMGAASVLLVLLSITVVVAVLAAAGVAFGIAVTAVARNRRWTIAGGALGGLVIGGVVKLLGLDAFTLLVGRSPGDITGPFEGTLIGAAVGFSVWLSARPGSLDRIRLSVAVTAVTCAVTGAFVVLLGGRMLGGSLALLEVSFPTSRLRLDRIGAFFGERGFGPIAQTVTGALEGALFGACVVGTMALARRALEERHS